MHAVLLIIAHVFAAPPQPMDATAHLNAGRAAHRAGQFKIALGHFDAALKVRPRSATIRNARGWARFKAGDLPGAQLDFTLALRWTRDAALRGRLHYNLGRVHARAGRASAALDAYRSSVASAESTEAQRRLDALGGTRTMVGAAAFQGPFESLKTLCAHLAPDEGRCEFASKPVAFEGRSIVLHHARSADGETWYSVVTQHKGAWWAMPLHQVDDVGLNYQNAHVKADLIVQHDHLYVVARISSWNASMGELLETNEHSIAHTLCGVGPSGRLTCAEPVVSEAGVVVKSFEFQTVDGPAGDLSGEIFESSGWQSRVEHFDWGLWMHAHSDGNDPKMIEVRFP